MAGEVSLSVGGIRIVSAGLVRGRRGCNKRYQKRKHSDVIHSIAIAGSENSKENVGVVSMKSMFRVLPFNLTPTEFPLGG